MTTRTFDNVTKFATHATIHAAVERYRLAATGKWTPERRLLAVEARDTIVSGYIRDVRYGLGGLRPFDNRLAPDRVAVEVADLYPEWLAMATEYFGLTLDELGHIFGAARTEAAVRDAVTSAVTRTILSS